jgi:hypothetical protein
VPHGGQPTAGERKGANRVRTGITDENTLTCLSKRQHATEDLVARTSTLGPREDTERVDHRGANRDVGDQIVRSMEIIAAWTTARNLRLHDQGPIGKKMQTTFRVHTW